LSERVRGRKRKIEERSETEEEEARDHNAGEKNWASEGVWGEIE
jgi:hypothetical protein